MSYKQLKRTLLYCRFNWVINFIFYENVCVCACTCAREYEMNMSKDICGNILNEYHDVNVP